MKKKGSKYSELDDRDWLHEKYWIERHSLMAIKDIIGCSYGALRHSFTVHSIMIRSISASYETREEAYPLLADYNWLYQRYWSEDLSPAKIANIIGCNSETVRRAIKKQCMPYRNRSESRRGKRNSMYGVHLSGEKSNNWKGGISFEPYCQKFNHELKERIREKFNRKCFLCGKTEEEQIESMEKRGKQPHKLSVHHIGGNKNQGCDGIKWLLVPLCISCHGKIEHNPRYWDKILLDKLKKNGMLT